jgi:hypothetical protein
MSALVAARGTVYTAVATLAPLVFMRAPAAVWVGEIAQFLSLLATPFVRRDA